MRYFIFADRFFLDERVEGPGYLEVVDGRFGSYSKKNPDCRAEIINYKGHFIGPGLVDTHIHGYKNHDIMDGDFEGLNMISLELLSCGVTSFLPTTLTSSEKELERVVAMIGGNYAKVEGAKVKGIFLEGPFFTEKYKGAQNPSYFQDPSTHMLQRWQELSNQFIKKIAIAPEREGSDAFIEFAVKQNISVALAHSQATYEEAKKAIEKGATTFVHTYNGMSPLHHREPGLVGAAMSLKNVFVELICDGHHVHPVAANILMNARGRKETVLVSDCMMAGGMPNGHYKLGEFPVSVENGAARLSGGGLAGSILQLKDAVKNTVRWDIASPEEAIYMASTAPAKSIGIDHESGKIAKDYAADFIILTPSLDLVSTYLDGVCRYKREG